MCECEKQMKNKYIRFNNMSTETLKKFLNQDSLLEENESDIDAIIYVTELIADRERTEDMSAENAAWQSFVDNYLPIANDTKPIYDEDTMSRSKTDIRMISLTKNKNMRRKRRFSKWICVSAALTIIFVVCSITAYAFEFNIFEAIAQWTENVFSFKTENYDNTKQEDSSDLEVQMFGDMQHALEAYNFKINVVPQKMPCEYTITDIEITDMLDEISIFAEYSNGTEKFFISATRMTDGTHYTYHEKDESKVVEYEKNGIIHYIIHNNSWVKAVWTYENYECYISGDISEECLKDMIDSIYQR